MITLPGVLTIRIVNGRYGEFRVGRLLAGIGEFAVKDAVLEQYREGSYEGVFGISRIYPVNYSAGGRLIIEIRADIKTIALSNINPLEQLDPLLEQDPGEEHKAIVPDTPATVLAPESEPESTNDIFEAGSGAVAIEADVQLFGLLWPLGEKIRLDATLDRNLFRQQRDRLKALGYGFNPIGQVWIKP